MKKQDINLLVGAPRRSSPRPTARQTGMALLVLVAFGVVAGLWQENRRASLEQAVATLNSDIDGAIMSLEEQSLYLAERDADPALVAELKRREREADDKSRVLDLLSGESVGNTDGFSAHLAAFGRRHPEGLWLENIRIGDGGRQLVLAGRALHAGLIPKFLGELQLEPALSGTAFATFTMSDDESDGGPMRFALTTACAEQDGSETVTPDPCVPFDDGPPEASFAAAEQPR